MKIFICPICNQPQECGDNIGDTCKVYHQICLDNSPGIVAAREFVQGIPARLEAQRKALQDNGLRR